MKEIQILSEGNPNSFGRKSKPDRKEIQGKPEGNPSICLPRIEPFQSLTPTPAAFSLFEADSGSLAHESRRCVFA
jgi:hypothetical protein